MISIEKALVLGFGICAGIIYTLVAEQGHNTIAKSNKTRSGAKESSEEIIFVERDAVPHSTTMSPQSFTH